jgi:DNA-binding transcriptional MocR family regulator
LLRVRVTAKFLVVLDALLWGFHNAATGRCFPSYESLAERAHCNRDTVYQAIHALERAGLLTWVNRIKRVREWGEDLFGRGRNRTRVVRTSNQYVPIDPKPAPDRPKASKSEITTGTAHQELKLTCAPAMPAVETPPKPKLDPANPVHASLLRWEAAVLAVK